MKRSIRTPSFPRTREPRGAVASLALLTRTAWVPAFAGMTMVMAAPSTATTYAITGGTVATVASDTPIENGTVIVTNGRVTAVGRGIAVPAGAMVIDATGKWVTPGIIAGGTNLGIDEVDGVDPTNDAAANKSPFSAALDIVPALNSRSSPIAVNRLGGVTRAAVSPGTGAAIFGGQGALIRLIDTPDLLDRPRAFQYIEMGEDGAKTAGGSRPALWANLRYAFSEAQRYAHNPAGYDSGREKESLLTRMDAAALAPVADGRIPALIHVERASDILAVLGSANRNFPSVFASSSRVPGKAGWSPPRSPPRMCRW